MADSLREELSTITFRPSSADAAVIKGLRGYLMEQQVKPSGGTVSDAVRFALHLTGLAMQEIVDGSKATKKTLIRLVENTHHVTDALKEEPCSPESSS